MTQAPSSSDGAQQQRRGRPPGEVTPEGLIRQELVAHLKLYRRTREIVEQHLNEDALDVDTLAKYMDLLRKGIVEMSKPILPNARPETVRPAAEDESTESILTRLMDGGR